MDKDLIPPKEASHDESESSFNDSESGVDHDVPDEKEPVIASQETKAVGRLKMVVLHVLATAAIWIAVSVYFYLMSNEEERFRQEFSDDAHKILGALGSALDRSLITLDSLAETLVSTAQVTNQTWPLVTHNDFAVRVSKVLPLSNAVVVTALHVVEAQQRKSWETYAAQHDDWVNQGLAVQEASGDYHGSIQYNGRQNAKIHSDIRNVPSNESRTMLVSWQTYPCTSEYSYSWDALTLLNPASYVRSMEERKAVMREPYMVASRRDVDEFEQDVSRAEFYRNFVSAEEEPREPMSDLLYPITTAASSYDHKNDTVVGILSGSIYWRAYLRDILPEEGSTGLHVVFENPCSRSFTYRMQGPNVTYVGVGDYHEKRYTSSAESRLLHTMASRSAQRLELDDLYCPITVHVYPSMEFHNRFTSDDPTIFTIAVVFIFAFVSMVFVIYDLKVERRQETVMNSAVRSSMIVSSLFPSEVRDRLFPSNETVTGGPSLPDTAKGKLKNFLKESRTASVASLPASLTGGAPIAELYPDTTVLFADISGFTAWSSERSPTQVFALLETVYGAFDAIAKQRGVFKVETIGDCYVAVVGLPAPRRNHAVVMARFAHDCREKMKVLAEELASSLGPGTADLAMRFGMNSGPTTAGVLRGEKSRFQLFGDTVNTAARMESNGLRNKIQVSQKTADLLRTAGKEHWLTQRDEKVDCKGKGMMTTFWCEPNVSPPGGSVYSMSVSDQSDYQEEEPTKEESHTSEMQRLVDWNVALFTELLRECMSSRTTNEQLIPPLGMEAPITYVQQEVSLLESPTTALHKDPFQTTVSQTVSVQLRELIGSIANGYNQNPFHDFEHASHVVLSTHKLLSRIVEREKEVQRDSHTVDNCTYGITCHPLTQWAILFAALVHDLEHAGVSNAQLVAEQDPLAVTYRGQSVAEQNSVHVAWTLLMQPQCVELRHCLFPTEAEMIVFRQVVAHAVMATDLFDQTLKAARDARWTTAFGPGGGSHTPPAPTPRMGPSRSKATIVIELIIQASDVSHTMQHFTVYQKWNQRLLAEMYAAYENGRMAHNPLDGWYDGELWFFDHYIIPLAQKLRECHVFGVSCDEFLDYAMDNRTEWELKGRDIVQRAKVALQGSLPPTLPDSVTLDPSILIVPQPMDVNRSDENVTVNAPSNSASEPVSIQPNVQTMRFL